MSVAPAKPKDWTPSGEPVPWSFDSGAIFGYPQLPKIELPKLPELHLPELPNPGEAVQGAIDGVKDSITSAVGGVISEVGHYLVLLAFAVLIILGLIVVTRNN